MRGTSWRRSTNGTSRRGRGERGTAMLELAIVMVPIFLISAGILEVGLLYRSASLTNSASRSGSRLATAIWATTADGSKNSTAVDQIRLTVQTDLSSRRPQDTPQALWIYKAFPNGAPNASGSFASCPATTCVQLTWNSVSSQFVYGSGNWTTEDACGKVVDSVGVYVKMQHVSLTKLPFGNATVDEHTVIRLEPLAFDKCNGETPL